MTDHTDRLKRRQEQLEQEIARRNATPSQRQAAAATGRPIAITERDEDVDDESPSQRQAAAVIRRQ